MVYNFYPPEAFVDQDELLYARSIKSLPALRAYINARMWWIAYNHKRKTWGHACILGGFYLPEQFHNMHYWWCEYKPGITGLLSPC